VPDVQRSEQVSEGLWLPECVICRESVKLEESKADEYGKAVHEDCYVSKLTRKSNALDLE
jgi:hypothetical protein